MPGKSSAMGKEDERPDGRDSKILKYGVLQYQDPVAVTAW